jgi:hypothetical protein
MLSSRASILNQVAAGQLSADEAASLLQPPPAADLKGRWLRVRVTRLDTGAPRVTVNLPMTWVQVGMQIGSRMGMHHHPEIAGLDWDEVLAALQSGAGGQIVEVENLDSNERIEVFVE